MLTRDTVSICKIRLKSRVCSSHKAFSDGDRLTGLRRMMHRLINLVGVSCIFLKDVFDVFEILCSLVGYTSRSVCVSTVLLSNFGMFKIAWFLRLIFAIELIS